MEELKSNTGQLAFGAETGSSSYSTDIRALNEMIQKESAFIDLLKMEMDKVIVGQKYMVERLLIGLLADGHILLEGVPGLAKTLAINTLSKAIRADFSRIQFTPDLLPADLIGTMIYNQKKEEFIVRKGPIFSNFILADEINRTPPKTQSALLEAMQERRVTVMGEGHQLPDPFFVLATQNPIELEGTYPLPEAQLDRFLFKLDIHRNEVSVLEKIVANREIGVEPEVTPVLSRDELLQLSALSRRIYLPDVVANYIARIVDATHPGRSQAAAGIKFGASPRAALGLAAAARSRALLSGRMNASFEDVQAMAKPVLQHRIILDYSAKLSGRSTAQVVDQVLAEVPAQDSEIPPVLEKAAS